MASQKSDTGKPESSTDAMMGLVSKMLAAITVILTTLFFAASFGVGPIGLMQTLKGLAIVLVPMLALCALAAIFLAPKAGAQAEAHTAKITALSEFQSKVASQILALQNQLDALSGQDIKALKARNAELQAELDAIHQLERDKVDGEIEALRKRNEELEEQIKKWAFEAVGKNVAGQPVQPMKAA
ncbi:hypothetical protein PZ897_04335 [Hoeflea sp. YIM 152468]|uniref:hypothetical protein n=1 Tax=Hoeflea sp. YIM 152468 TaxID=3031759 RepID=UPI0023DA970A|nr:hypothetical protein [Hoeflea sp. YIM 152468]MDF1607396.1 hypothetical protein [Hoeflea sp. YIM 152468]